MSTSYVLPSFLILENRENRKPKRTFHRDFQSNLIGLGVRPKNHIFERIKNKNLMVNVYRKLYQISQDIYCNFDNAKIIGIHTGVNSNVGYKVGTMITDDILIWICSVVYQTQFIAKKRLTKNDKLHIYNNKLEKWTSGIICDVTNDTLTIDTTEKNVKNSEVECVNHLNKLVLIWNINSYLANNLNEYDQDRWFLSKRIANCVMSFIVGAVPVVTVKINRWSMLMKIPLDDSYLDTIRLKYDINKSMEPKSIFFNQKMEFPFPNTIDDKPIKTLTLQKLPNGPWIPSSGYNDQSQCDTWLDLTAECINGYDKRLRCPPKYHSMEHMTQNFGIIITKSKIGKYTCGTATLLGLQGYNKQYGCRIQYGITCAHNLVTVFNNRIVRPESNHSIWFKQLQNVNETDCKELNTFNVVGYHIYEKYEEKHRDYYSGDYSYPYAKLDSGFDIALIEIKDDNFDLCNQYKKHFMVDHTSNNCAGVKIIGYPGEQDKFGELYGMIGRIDESYVNYKTGGEIINLRWY